VLEKAGKIHNFARLFLRKGFRARLLEELSILIDEPRGDLFRVALVIQRQQATEDLFARCGGNGVADPVVFRKKLELVEAVLKIEALPAVGVPDCFID